MDRPHVLVVDDEESILTFADAALTYAGYTVTTALNGPEALRIVQDHGVFDLFVLDILMPQMRGDELAREIRVKHPDAKILYFTGYVDRLFAERQVLWANEAFIEKPVTLNGLVEAASLMLTGRVERLRST